MHIPDLYADVPLQMLKKRVEALEQKLAKPEQEAYGYAKRLAEFIWEKHYKKESPDWTPLPDVLGVLTQIDNMTCGLEKAKPEQEPKQEPVSHLWECLGRWSSYLAVNGTQGNLAPPTWLVDAVKAATAPPRKEWVGLTDVECIKLIDEIQISSGDYELLIARAIELLLRNKNT